MPSATLELYKATYDPLIELGRGVPDTRRTFGKKEDVDQVRHLLGTAWGWAGLPEQEAYYLNVEPNLPVGAYQLQIKDVPVDAFWSVSVYNRDGYFEKNEVGLYSVNSVTGKPNTDGSFTIHCPASAPMSPKLCCDLRSVLISSRSGGIEDENEALLILVESCH